MKLQDLCDEIEKKFGLIVQIKTGEKPGRFGSHLTVKHLEVSGPGIVTKIISGDAIEEASLSWWLTGLIQGAGMMREAWVSMEVVDEPRRSTG